MAVRTTIRITEQDYTRLRHVVDARARHSRYERELEMLEERLESARVVRADGVPHDVVTMNSRVLFRDMHSGESGTVTIAYPSETDPLCGRISVLSPVGAALLGAAEGQEVELPLPHGGRRRIRIENVLYQPEAEGDFAL